MSFAVKHQMRLHAGKLEKGDVLCCNSPSAGGSHLPDITVITPCFSEAGDIVFFTASRGHQCVPSRPSIRVLEVTMHSADIGGIAPGSMPPNSTSLLEEGVRLPCLY